MSEDNCTGDGHENWEGVFQEGEGGVAEAFGKWHVL